MVFEIVQAVFAAGASLALLVFAGITLGGSAVGLAISTPLFIIFSPILVPATIATSLLATGFAVTGSSGGMGLKIFMWLLKKYTGQGIAKTPGTKSKDSKHPKGTTSKSKPADSGGKTE